MLQEFSLRAGCRTSWPAVRIILSSWFDWPSRVTFFVKGSSISLKNFTCLWKPVSLLVENVIETPGVEFFSLFCLDLTVPQGFHWWSKKQACHCHRHHSGKWWVSCISQDINILKCSFYIYVVLEGHLWTLTLNSVNRSCKTVVFKTQNGKRMKWH